MNDKRSTNIPTLSEKAEQGLKKITARYPHSKSAVMPALYIAQEELGYISEEAVLWVSNRLGLSPAHVRGVATFYTMYYRKKVGRYHVQVCRTLSCMLCGARELVEYLKSRFQLAAKEVSADGMWSYEEVECLGSCGTGPMVEINDVYFENLTVSKLKDLLDRIEKEKPDLRYSAAREELGAGFKDLPKSEVW